MPLTFEAVARRRRDARVGRRPGARRLALTSPACWRGSPGSSATSPAGSACHAGSARCARRNCSPGWRAAPARRSPGRARPARGHRLGHPRRLDLRARPDGGHRRRSRAVRLGLIGSIPECAETDMTAVFLGTPRRLVDVTIDGEHGPRARGCDAAGGVPPAGRRHAHAVLPGEPDPGERLPGLRGRGGRLPHAGARLLAQGRGRHEGAHRLRARPHQPQDGPGVPGVVRGRQPRVGGRAAVDRGVRRRPGTVRPGRRRPRGRRAGRHPARGTSPGRRAPTPTPSGSR